MNLKGDSMVTEHIRVDETLLKSFRELKAQKAAFGFKFTKSFYIDILPVIVLAFQFMEDRDPDCIITFDVGMSTNIAVYTNNSLLADEFRAKFVS